MSIIDFTRTFPQALGQKIPVVTWAALGANDTGAPFVLGQYADRSVQVSGTITAGSITMKGSLDGTEYHTLTDPQGNPLVFTAGKLEAVSELTYYIRPEASADYAGTAVVTLIAKGAA